MGASRRPPFALLGSCVRISTLINDLPQDLPQVEYSCSIVVGCEVTRDDFVFLYDACSAALHSRNPFSARTAVEIKYDFPVWVERIRSLLRIHIMQFVDDRRWLVYVPDHGQIQVFTVVSDPSVM
jgi:hypothetical protein